jgi:hypothetical protein
VRDSWGDRVFLADGDDDQAGGALVYLVEHSAIPARPDAKLFLPPGNFVVAARARIFLEFEDCPSDPQEGVVVQLEQFAFGGAPKSDLKHGAS